MPRIAATVGSLLLIACSIAVNTVRYPVVSQMVGAVCETPEPNAAPATMATSIAPADTVATAAKPRGESSPPAVVRELPPPSMLTDRQASDPPAQARRTEKTSEELFGHIVGVQAVPASNEGMPSIAASSITAAANAEPAEMRRLPPVEPPGESRPLAAPPPPAIVRSYPSTGVN